MDLTVWDATAVRELFCVLYGGHRDSHGEWHPNVHEAARRRRVSVRTVQRWLKARDDGQASIPPAQLAAITGRRRVRRSDLRREELQRMRQKKMLEREALGRGRGNLRADYSETGWLEPHVVLVLEDTQRPLRRIAVVKDSQTARRRATRGATVVDVSVARNKFLAERTRYEYLEAVGPWRIMLPGRSVPTGHTQVWLASAPLPTTPLNIDE
ncbi:hypothetical protein [Promicromonospora sp. NFX87]|uniref:hypothetical protein n=1 Tax=Promicromonospora sp. NFX87 TaxID=3402691 RepID=UPI003AFA07BA